MHCPPSDTPMGFAHSHHVSLCRDVIRVDLLNELRSRGLSWQCLPCAHFRIQRPVHPSRIWSNGVFRSRVFFFFNQTRVRHLHPSAMDSHPKSRRFVGSSELVRQMSASHSDSVCKLAACGATTSCVVQYLWLWLLQAARAIMQLSPDIIPSGCLGLKHQLTN